MTDEYAYETAKKIRAAAEKSNNPDVYELAATWFEVADMQEAAASCRDRAKHYRETVLQP